MKAQTEFPEQGKLLKGKVEYFVSAVLTKVKILWKSESASTGIQFYVETDD